jgi:hypothetical protein
VNQSRILLDEAQSDLIAFTRKQGVVSAGLERDLVLQKLSDAVAGELGLESAIAEAGARLRGLDANLHDLPQRRVVEIKNADNPQLEEKMKSKLLELQLQRTALITKFQPSYRLVQEVDEQMPKRNRRLKRKNLNHFATKPLKMTRSLTGPIRNGSKPKWNFGV